MEGEKEESAELCLEASGGFGGDSARMPSLTSAWRSRGGHELEKLTLKVRGTWR